MKYPKIHRLRWMGLDYTYRVIYDYFYDYGEIEIRFSDGSSLVCDMDHGECTWWYDHAYNIPSEQKAYLRHDQFYSYIKNAIKRKLENNVDIDEIIVSRYGEERHILTFK